MTVRPLIPTSRQGFLSAANATTALLRARLSCLLLVGSLLVGSLLVGSSLATALPDDREQPIHITADKAVRDEKQGLTVYSGNVQMRQGSMELDADSLTIFHAARDANKIVARGAPAKMRQQPELDKGLVHAHASVITYFRREELVHLRTDAELTRDDGTLVTGDSIDYYIARELVRAESDRSNQDRKVVVVIPPSMINDEDEASPPSDVAAQPEGSISPPPSDDIIATPEASGDNMPRSAPAGNVESTAESLQESAATDEEPGPVGTAQSE